MWLFLTETISFKVFFYTVTDLCHRITISGKRSFKDCYKNTGLTLGYQRSVKWHWQEHEMSFHIKGHVMTVTKMWEFLLLQDVMLTTVKVLLAWCSRQKIDRNWLQTWNYQPCMDLYDWYLSIVVHSKKKKYFRAPFLVLQVVTNRGLNWVPGRTK